MEKSVLPPLTSAGFTISLPSDFKFIESKVVDGKTVETHEYLYGTLILPSPSSLFEEFGLIDKKYFTKEAQDRGHHVHLACQFYDEGTLDNSSVMPEYTGYLNAYEKFLRESSFKPITELTEKPLMNKLHRFGTTPDRLGWLNGQWVIIDIKTGVPHWTTALQLAAQELAILECVSSNYFDYIGSRKALCLKSNGTYSLKDSSEICENDVNSIPEFLGLVSTHHLKWRKNDQ